MSEKYEFDARRYCQHNMERLGRMPNGQLVGLLMIREIDSRDVEIEDMKAEFAALKSNGGQAQECNCDMRTKLVGDGCEVCNPTLALEHMKETIADLRAELAELREAVKAAKVDWECCILTGQSTAYDNLARLCGEE